MTTSTAQFLVRNRSISARAALPVLKNLGLIACGSVVFVYGMNAIMIPAKLFSGGLTGVAILLSYQHAWLDVGTVYLLLNIPLLVLGWVSISKRFIAYSIFGILFFSFAAAAIRPPVIALADPLLSALLAGVVCGAGCGLILRSLGSAGGMDILAIFLNKRYGVRIGTIFFTANTLVIVAGVYFSDLNSALYSTLLLFISGHVINVVVSGFNARMSVMVISEQSEPIARDILERLNRGVTFLDGEGAFSRNPKRVILTVATLTDLPKLKEMIFRHDATAFVVVNKTLEVIGQRHGVPRIY
jgi:uncharacterized membrane-anchored protein YitT (DUF2179 family)